MVEFRLKKKFIVRWFKIMSRTLLNRKITCVIFTLYLCSNLSEGTELTGMISDKRMNMNVLRMFDRFFHLRHKDAFFIRNFENHLTDDYLTSFYTKEFEITPTLKKDLSMHAIYLENTVWYSSSITELFTVLYAKYLAASHIISFVNCHTYYTYGDINKEKATKCKKIVKYLYYFMKIAVEKYVLRTEDYLYLIQGIPENTYFDRPYQNFFYALSEYFIYVTSLMIRENAKPQVPKNKDEFLTELLLQEIKAVQNVRLTLKYFFRNVFFGTRLKNQDFLRKKMEEEINVLNNKKLNSIHNETIKFWEYSDKLVEKIETTDPTILKLNTRKTANGESITEKFVKSNAINVIRKLEMKKLIMRGIQIKKISELKNGSDMIYQLFVMPNLYEDHDLKFKFVPLEPEKLTRPTLLTIKDYVQIGQILDDEQFSGEDVNIKKESSLENYNSAIEESFKSETNESYKTVASAKLSSNQISDKSQSLYNKLIADAIRRKMKATLSAQSAELSSNVNYENNSQRTNDFSHLASYMAPNDRRYNSNAIDQSISSPKQDDSNYYDVSQSNMSDYQDNIPATSRFSSSPMVAVY